MEAPACVTKLKNERKCSYVCQTFYFVKTEGLVEKKKVFLRKVTIRGFPKFNIIGRKCLETVSLRSHLPEGNLREFVLGVDRSWCHVKERLHSWWKSSSFDFHCNRGILASTSEVGKLWEYPDTIIDNFDISRNVLPFTRLRKEAEFVRGIVIWEISFFNEEDVKVCLLLWTFR